MNVNDAPKILQDLIDDQLVQTPIGYVLSLPFVLFSSAFASEAEISNKKWDQSTLNQIQIDLRVLCDATLQINQMSSSQKTARIGQQILATRQIAEGLRTLKSSHYRSLLEGIEERAKMTLDAMMDEDPQFVKESTRLKPPVICPPLYG